MRSAPFVLAALMAATQATGTSYVPKEYKVADAQPTLNFSGKVSISEYNKKKVGQVMQGVLESFGGKFDLYALLICIYDEDQAALMFDVAV